MPKLLILNNEKFFKKTWNIVILQQCSGQFYVQFWLIVLSNFFRYKSFTSMNSSISFSHFFRSLAVGSFWQLRSEQSLKQTHYWLFRLTTLKGRDVFFSFGHCFLGSTGHWVGCWVCGLTLIFKVKYKDLSIRTNMDSKFY